jgi:hypothetical protein
MPPPTSSQRGLEPLTRKSHPHSFDSILTADQNLPNDDYLSCEVQHEDAGAERAPADTVSREAGHHRRSNHVLQSRAPGIMERGASVTGETSRQMHAERSAFSVDRRAIAGSDSRKPGQQTISKLNNRR